MPYDELPNYRDAKRQWEREFLREALERNDGIMRRAGQAIGLDTSQVLRKTRALGLHISRRVEVDTP